MQGIRFFTEDSSPGRSPKTMTVEGSNSGDPLLGTSWALLYSGTAGLDTTPDNSTGNKVSFVNTTAYTSYRVLFPTTVGHHEVQLANIGAYGTETVVSSPYDTWKAGPFANAFTDTDLTHDPAGDGLTNFQEYAFGLDPTTGASANPVTPLVGDQFTTPGMPLSVSATPSSTATIWPSGIRQPAPNHPAPPMHKACKPSPSRSPTRRWTARK